MLRNRIKLPAVEVVVDGDDVVVVVVPVVTVHSNDALLS